MSNFGKIIHDRPDPGLFRKRGITAVDMHFHSRYSDGVNKVRFILKKARQKGIGVCLTDHNVIRGSMIASRCKDVLTIPGIEVTAKEGCHILFYFYSIRELENFYYTNIKPKKAKTSPFLRISAEEIIDRSRRYSCISIMAHPYAIAWTGMMNCVRNGVIRPEAAKKLDGIEAITGSNLRIPNKRSIELALKMKGRMITGGSDGHIFYEMGHTLTFAKENIDNTRDFFEAVAKRRVFVVGKETKFLKKHLAHSTKPTTRGMYALNYMGK
ncbi:hypothetical protein GF351_01550, partial [Candidatus Woesearchaeota archaeon]|nr:hypothetical protein [Candidatus Woesearchaeota archaeon]